MRVFLRTILLISFFGLVQTMKNMLWAGTDSNSCVPTTYSELKYSPAQTVFTLWAPTASHVRINLYVDGRVGSPYEMLTMSKKNNGFWSAFINGDLKGKFYTFQTCCKGDWLSETPGILAEAVGVNGNRAAIIDMRTTNPLGWNQDIRPELGPFTDMVIYQMHFRDFSMGPYAGVVHKGKFLALTEAGTANHEGAPTGLDHLIDLGVSHVLLMPSFDFVSADESRPKDNLNYWCYNPQNFNVPEGSFSSKPFDPVSRIREFKQMVLALHKVGIRVLLDVSYDHTQSVKESCFNLTVPDFYYRHQDDGTCSKSYGYGNELASEKPVIRQYIVRSLLYWAKEYHVDGFRFDQMGLLDIETMNQIRQELDRIDPTIFVCGESLLNEASPLSASLRALPQNRIRMPRIAFSNNAWLDAVKGNEMDSMAVGFVNGRSGMEEQVKEGIVGLVKHPQVCLNESDALMTYASDPSEVINYVSSHKGYCLYDQFAAASNHTASPDLLIRWNKLAQGLVLTSQGIPLLFSGEEIQRSRGGVANAKTTPDSVSRIDWRNKSTYADLFNYDRDMIQLRKDHPAFRMINAAEVVKKLRFFEMSEKNMVGFLLGAHANGDCWKNILVVHNANRFPVKIEVPAGRWTTVVYDGVVNPDGISNFDEGGMLIPAVSTVVAYQN
jgi:pullulanase